MDADTNNDDQVSPFFRFTLSFKCQVRASLFQPKTNAPLLFLLHECRWIDIGINSSSSSKLVLYSYWQSSCSWRVRFALKLKGLIYEYKAVDLSKGEQFSPEFEELNPLHFVPVLVDGDVVVSDSYAILLVRVLCL